MTLELERRELFETARDTRFPRTWIGRVLVEGEAAWARAVQRATPAERDGLLRGLERPLLLATPGGRACAPGC